MAKQLLVNDRDIFRHDKGNDVELIEVSNQGRSRNLVTDGLATKYIEADFRDTTTGSKTTMTEPRTDSLKLFFSVRHGGYNGEMIPISMSKDLFERIAPYARVPEIYRELLYQGTATHVYATPQLPPHLSGLQPDVIREEFLGFIIQSVPGAMDHICISASFTYHFKSQTMYTFMHGLESSNFRLFAEALEQGATRTSAFLIPSLVVQFNLENRSKAINVWHDRIYSHERELGIRYDLQNTANLANIDFTKLSKDLNAATTNLAYVVWQCKTSTRCLEFMDSVAKRYRILAVKNGIPEGRAAEVETLLLEMHDHLRSWNAGLEDKAEYLSKRGKALVQTVYSGIAQRDSLNSLSLARTSTKLAETTSRDSAVMRIITFITGIFLPATFTATMFSTSFFDFSVGRNGAVYSWWLWLYFVVTLALTVIVGIGAWIVWRKTENEMMLTSRKQTPLQDE